MFFYKSFRKFVSRKIFPDFFVQHIQFFPSQVTHGFELITRPVHINQDWYLGKYRDVRALLSIHDDVLVIHLLEVEHRKHSYRDF
jgi:mRNA-degrading endonuclease RelE of RelBE toxin-antitoxin system